MNIFISLHKISNEKAKANIKNTIYKYSNLYVKENEIIEILSSKEISQKEVDSLGKIYLSDAKDRVLKKGYIDLFIDKYIILNY